MVIINNVSKKYKKVQALCEVNFSILENQIIGLVGPNGAGKSTLMRIISGINHPTSGKVILQNNSQKNASVQISTVFDFNGLYPQLTAYENLLFFLKLKDSHATGYDKIIDEVLEQMQLSDWKYQKTKVFSKGMLRKLTIARAIITNPNLLILDEPFDGLDIESHRFVINFLKKWVTENERSILFASHNMSDVEDFCSKVIMINGGKIVMEKQLFDIKEEGYQYLKIRFTGESRLSDIKAALDGFSVEIVDGSIKQEVFIYTQEEAISDIVRKLYHKNFAIEEVIKEYRNVEDVYLKIMGGIS